MNRRRMPLILALAAVFVLASLGWLVPLSRDIRAAPAPSGDALFKGKLLVIITNNTMMPAFLLEKAQVQKLGDHSYVVGKGVADDDDNGANVAWCKGRTVRIQMEHIVSITEFDDFKDVKRALETTAVRRGAVYRPAVPLPATPPAVAPLPAVPVPAAPPAVAPHPSAR